MKTTKIDIKKPTSDLARTKLAVVSTYWNQEIIEADA